MRGRDATWAMIYTTVGKDFTVDLARLKGPEIEARWFDPRTGVSRKQAVSPHATHGSSTRPARTAKTATGCWCWKGLEHVTRHLQTVGAIQLFSRNVSR